MRDLQRLHKKLKASYTSSLRPHTLVLKATHKRAATELQRIRISGLQRLHKKLKASYTSSLRPHTLVLKATHKTAATELQYIRVNPGSRYAGVACSVHFKAL
jgi:hypothetical protein